MSVSIIKGTNKKPVASQQIADVFASNTELDGNLYLGYPILGTPEGRYAIDALWLSPKYGIVIFDLVEGRDAGQYQERQDSAVNLLEARLKVHKDLVKRRTLLTPIHAYTFAPAATKDESSDETLLASNEQLYDAISQIPEWLPEDLYLFERLLSAIQNISTIRKSRTARKITFQESRGARLKSLEDSIATLDTHQSQAVVETAEGVQRIRGLAGSGKTIVLALKAAYLHAQHPEWTIAVTFNTRSLKGQFQRLINTFCIEQTGEEPDWRALRILNAWGAPGGRERDGIYHQFCNAVSRPYYDFRSAKAQFGAGNEFKGACEQVVRDCPQPSTQYDAILVDEAQDFPPVFLRLCYEFLSVEKRLVYAYDELQSLSGEALPPPEEIFGNDSNNNPRVTLTARGSGSPRHDILLEKCYRNSRPVLVTGHALGFGIYREKPANATTGLVQMFDYPSLWEDVGYEVKSGALEGDSEVVLRRTAKSSPPFLENHSSIDDLVQFKRFDNQSEQNRWVADEIEKNVTQEDLRCEDIIVINSNPLETRDKVGPIRKDLFNRGINSHLAGVDTSPDIFFSSDEESITFTGIYRAKGNEAGMVYIINSDDFQSSTYNLARARNRLFTAITRAKAWVRVLGVGSQMSRLQEEFNRLKDMNFELRFRYPTEEERKKLEIIHRDMTTEEKKRLTNRKKNLEKLVLEMEQGDISIEDLDDDTLERLRNLLRTS